MFKGKLKFQYKVENESKLLEVTEEYDNEDLSITFNESNHEKLTINLKTKKKILIESCRYEMKRDYFPSEKIFVNGFQSWTDSKEFSYKDKMTSISSLAKPVIKKFALDKYGDYSFANYTKKSGFFHGFTYSYIRHHKRFEFMGSLSEKNGYTIIYHDMKNNKLELHKDIQNIIVEQNYNLFDVCYLVGSEDEVFDRYFQLMHISKPKYPKMNGWTSWYNYYEDISESIIVHNLETIANLEKNIDIFQIDDGYETFVGDWLEVDYNKFPNGMEPLARKIKEKGYKAGIWLAPFVCETNSTIYSNHKDWLLKDELGEFVHAGHNWSGFYCLDIYNEEVRHYIKTVFDTVLNEWGFDMVKLDFLYAISLIPYQNKSRGQIMCEGMEFLRECVGDKIILGCGVPLGPSFGLVDYCRIGCDVGLDWNDKKFMQLMHRERISTLNAITNSIYRRQLNNRAFMNDPDVFLLREDNIKLTQSEKELLAFVNQLFGSLIFTSDDLAKYDDNMTQLFDRTMDISQTNIDVVDEKLPGLIYISYEVLDKDQSLTSPKRYNCYINLTSHKIKYKGIIINKKSVYI